MILDLINYSKKETYMEKKPTYLNIRFYFLYVCIHEETNLSGKDKNTKK